MNASRFFSRIATVFAFAALGAWAQAGLPYTKLEPPQPTEGNGKIEVIEFFWYGCPHCYRLEPSLNAWLKNKPADVDFKRVHALPSAAWAPDAKIFYTLEAMNLVDSLHDKVFDAIHKDNKNLKSPKVLDEWLKQNGVDPAKYHDVEKSFSVDSKLKRANQLTVAYKVDGVPRVIVDGKFATGPEEAGGEDRIMGAVDQMIAAERKAGAGAHAAAAAPTKKK
ncbi:MAG TPA: thiol:disulfide interchange protein DsbA/DsbL [Usitatibacter sp.]|jgi:thiol:disulfide interchange protein DsbA|nr:thiol:disulfide interchange protein DsbA/DsbL [Usitatibacter sp.]